MSTTTKIHVTACDNELYILASPADGRDSLEIVHIKSGFSDPVEYKLRPQTCLAPGKYNLTMVGLNWGGPDAFKVTLTTGGVDHLYSSPGTGQTGVSWSQTVPITV